MEQQQLCKDPNKEIGLVFSGGGLKGGYEIGVWKALDEKGVTPLITAVSGTSIGAMNGMLFARGDYAYAENLWLGVQQSDLMYLPEKDAQKEGEKTAQKDDAKTAQAQNDGPGTKGQPAPGTDAPEKQTMRSWLTSLDVPALLAQAAAGVPLPAILDKVWGDNWQTLVDAGVFSQQRLVDMIHASVTRQQAAVLEKDLLVTCTKVKKAAYLLDLDAGTERVTFDVRSRAAEYEKLLTASAAIPGVYPPVEIDGDLYVDGGLAEGGNTPVMPLYARGYRRIIVVYLQKRPEARIRKRDYPFAEFVELIPGEELYTGPLAAIQMPEGGMATAIDAGYHDAMSTCLFQ